jgi:hypothetical protein
MQKLKARKKTKIFFSQGLPDKLQMTRIAQPGGALNGIAHCPHVRTVK